jgi:FAD binding domain
MNRRQFLKSATAISILSTGCSQVLRTSAKAAAQPVSRVRPDDPSWPSAASWDRLRREVRGRLIKVESPLTACQTAPEGTSYAKVFKQLKNPYYIGDQPALTQTSGWVDAWTSAPSVYAVAAVETADVVAAVNFARENNLRLVVKGGGHRYQGTSNSVDSLLIWTRAMNRIVLHDAFVAQGCARKQAPQPAVTVGAGAIWMHVYDAVTTQAGRYVQGGGCTTVGARDSFRAAGSAASPRTTAWPRRACWKPKSSPRTARCGSPMSARIQICSGRSKVVEEGASAS